MPPRVAWAVLGVLIALGGWRWVGGREGSPSSSPAASAPPVMELRAEDDGREFHLHAGQWLAVRLPASSAAGYRCWLQDPAVAVLEVEQDPARIGGSHAWMFRSARAGVGELRFECHPELSGEPVRRITFHIRSD